MAEEPGGGERMRRIHIRKTKKVNGETWRRVKGWQGQVYWVYMTPGEVRERRLYQAAVVAMPLVSILVFALIAGMI